MAGIARAPLPSSTQRWVSLLNQSGLSPGANAINFDNLWDRTIHRAVSITLASVQSTPAQTFSFSTRSSVPATLGTFSCNPSGTTLTLHAKIDLVFFDTDTRVLLTLLSRYLSGVEIEELNVPSASGNIVGFRISTGAANITSIDHVLVEGLLV